MDKTLFRKIYYKLRQFTLLQIATKYYYKLQQVRYYKLRQVLINCDDRYYTLRQVLQIAPLLQLICDSTVATVVSFTLTTGTGGRH